MFLPGAALVLYVLDWVFVAIGLYAFVHAVRQRADAFTTVDKLTKGKWLGITGAASVVMLPALFGAISSFIGIIGVVAVLVYLADVRPKVEEIQRGGQRW